MSSEDSAECALNTTECILKAVASILSEVQDQNSEYNWDPVTFAFTAVIGLVALVFAGLTIVQTLLAAGPGRIKSGAYAIGPWARLNTRRLDWVEMRFLTTSYTPVLMESAMWNSEWETVAEPRVTPAGFRMINDDSQDPETLKKGLASYFPATWLALLTSLGLDETSIWKTKSTGADYIPSEFSTVPAYGSVGFIVTLAMILSDGEGRLFIDPESRLPMVQSGSFNLTFRQHPLLGAVGFFEMYDARAILVKRLDPLEIRNRVSHAYGYMDVLAERGEQGTPDRQKYMRWHTMGPRWNYIYEQWSRQVAEELLSECKCKDDEALPSQRCCGPSLQDPWPCCCDFFEHCRGCCPDLGTDGPLYLLTADAPRSPPLLFPHRKARLREKLDLLLLQSRFWTLKASGYLDLDPGPPNKFSKDERHLTEKALSPATKMLHGPAKWFRVGRQAYELCSAFVSGASIEHPDYRNDRQQRQIILQCEISSVDEWLSSFGSLHLCRRMTLAVIGLGIHQMKNGIQHVRADAATAIDRDKFESCALHDKLRDFLQAFQEPNSRSYLFPGPFNYFSLDIPRRPSDAGSDVPSDPYLEMLLDCFPGDYADFKILRGDVYGALVKIRERWETRDAEDGRADTDPDKARRRQVWQQPTENQHPLDDLLIYRAVLVALLYSLATDSSDLVRDEYYQLVVPIM
ncbi:hypothetical protein ACJ41O_009967 [Fusarium nematophilum]